MQPFEITWEAEEFEYHPKTISWYWASIIVAVCVIAFSVWQRNFLFGFFVVIAEIMMLVWGDRKPRTVPFTLNEKGIAIGNFKTYSYDDIQNFSVQESGEYASLSLRLKRRFRAPVVVRIPVSKLEVIRKALKFILPEVEFERSLLDTLEQFLGF